MHFVVFSVEGPTAKFSDALSFAQFILSQGQHPCRVLQVGHIGNETLDSFQSIVLVPDAVTFFHDPANPLMSTVQAILELVRDAVFERYVD